MKKKCIMIMFITLYFMTCFPGIICVASTNGWRVVLEETNIRDNDFGGASIKTYRAYLVADPGTKTFGTDTSDGGLYISDDSSNLTLTTKRGKRSRQYATTFFNKH